jgi:hypothetical protein
VPELQVSVFRQVAPHAPQLAVAVNRSTQLEPQAVRPAPLQRHTPAEQAWPVGHWLPQPPQLALSLLAMQTPSQ